MALNKYKYWYNKEPTSKINVACLLPNGICISLPFISADTPLHKIKTQTWLEAERYALFHLLKPKDQYVFEVVSSKGGTEELLYEQLSLYDYRPVRPYLKVVERHGDEVAKRINSKVSMLIGRSSLSQQSSKSEEVDDFRKRCLEYCEQISYQRGRSSWERRAIYTYPPEYNEDDELPIELKAKLVFSNWNLTVCVYTTCRSNSKLIVNFKTLPVDLLKLALEKKAQAFKEKFPERTNDYVLKVFGRMNFFLGDCISVNGQDIYVEKPLIQYKYIQDSLLWNHPINLQLFKKHELDIERIVPPKSFRADEQPPIPPKKNLSIWNLSPSTMFRIKIICALNINAPSMMKEVVCCVFHGSEVLCELRKTTLKSGVNPQWNEFLEFELPVSQLPRMAKLCFSVIGYQKGEPKSIIAWVNVPIMDFKGHLRTGLSRLYCWSNYGGKLKSDDNLLNPLGTVALSENESGPCIVIDTMRFANIAGYPPECDVIDLAVNLVNRTKAQECFPTHLERLQMEECIRRDSLAILYDSDKELLWKFRFVCCWEYADSLPKLLQCLKWSNRDDVAQMYYLLNIWHVGELSVEIALDLLDYRFPDNKVRYLAVRTLDNLSDGELEMYLLQLTQALKNEQYLDSPLAKYLLRRALNNRRIGHYLFWHLKAEVRNHDCSLQFGLLLEMYCYGATSHMDILLRQVEAINKLKTVTEILQAYKDPDKQKKLALMRDLFRKDGYVKAFSNLVSPLDPSMLLKELKVDKCKYMDSAKKPLWLVFENADEGSDDICIIFKNGDDLRQDMLTILSLRIMENLWRKAGLEYGLIPYKCLSTGNKIGLIEVVRPAETLARIQAEIGGRFGVLREASLYKWIATNHSNENENLQVCVGNFTRSVVGYSIATYVLGIGDRHNDNVMMKEDTGQLFHIDFGHFLGNFKSKFNIRRERVKFVLPDEFIYIIERNERGNSKRRNFTKFKEMCIEAFMALRKHGNLFITIFAMLLSTGIPELRQPSDLDFLRDSFALLKDENEAIKHFESVFREAYDKRKTTSLNWMIHNMKHHWT